MFRRGNDGARGGTAQDSRGAQSPGDPQTTDTGESGRARPAAEAAKGRPTPKRSEAERGRRQGITGTPARPGARGGSARGGSGRSSGGKESREDRLRRTEAMRRGEEWALPARDRGPVKALARDYVDSKRRISEYYMYVMIAVIIVLFVRAASVQLYAEPVALVLIVFVRGGRLLPAAGPEAADRAAAAWPERARRRPVRGVPGAADPPVPGAAAAGEPGREGLTSALTRKASRADPRLSPWNTDIWARAA